MNWWTKKRLRIFDSKIVIKIDCDNLPRYKESVPKIINIKMISLSIKDFRLGGFDYFK